MHLNFTEESYSWTNFLITKDSKNKLAQILPIENSWSKEIIQYGKIDGTCIKLIYSNRKLVEISCRLDIRNLTNNLLLDILEFINNNRALIVADEIICEPTLENIFILLKNSNAIKFYKDPEKFLDELDSNK